MSPIVIEGFVRLRRHLFGRQADFGTKVPATRAYAFSGTPSSDLAWTDNEGDVGSRDPVAPPFRGASEVTAALTDPSLAYNTIPLLMSAFFGGAEAPDGTGGVETWTHAPASLTVDDLDKFTYEFGDDVTDDWFQLGDGVLESLEISGPEGLGPLTTSMTWRFGSVSSTGSTDSPADVGVPQDLSVDINSAYVYLKDGGIFIASDPDDLDTNQITDALHTFTLRFTQEIDLKRFANMTQKFDISAYGPGTRGIELECTFAKTADTVGLGSEADAWFSDSAVNRYIRLKFISTAHADGDPGSGGTPYSWIVTMPMRYYTREEGEIGGNTTVVLTAHAFYDPGTGSGLPTGVFESVAVTSLTEAELGLAGS